MAKKLFSIDRIITRRCNPDGTVALPSRIVGGIGPFDYSGITGTDTPLVTKIDFAAAVTSTISLAGVSDQSAVTVDELVTAIQAASITGLTASKESGTNRLLIVADAAESDNLRIGGVNANPVRWLQVYGECAEIAGIGYGAGIKFKVDTDLAGASDAIDRQDAETVDLENGVNELTQVEFPAKVLGRNMTATYNSKDLERSYQLAGGTYDATNGTYEDPISSDVPPQVTAETFQRIYGEGKSGFSNFNNVERILYKSGTAAPADRARDARAFTSNPFDFSFPGYTDENDVAKAAAFIEELSEAEYSAFDFDNLIA